MDLSIIIVNYKSADKTNACIDSIKKSDTFGIEYEIIVVDNNSEDNSDTAIRSKNNDVLVIESGSNLGMGGGNNLGILSATGNYLLILNADTLIKNNSVKKLYEFIKNHKDVGVVGPRLLNTDGGLQYSCMRFPKFYTPLLRRTFLGGLFKKHINRFLMKDFNHKEIKEVDWLMGSCLMVPKNIIGKIGKIFNKRFYMYFEDTDLCRRTWEAGLKVVYYPEAEVVHDHGRGSASKPWYLAPFTDRLAREHIKSWIKYFMK